MERFAFKMKLKPGVVEDLGREEVVRRWWAHMAPLIETNADLSPVSAPLPEVFHLD